MRLVMSCHHRAAYVRISYCKSGTEYGMRAPESRYAAPQIATARVAVTVAVVMPRGNLLLLPSMHVESDMTSPQTQPV